MIERFKKAKKIELSNIIPTNNFRIVDIELRDMSCGITEIPVTIEFNKDYNPPYKDLMVGGLFIHGFVRMNEELAKLNGNVFRRGNSSDVIKRIYITDWDGAFLLSLSLNRGGEYKYAVTNDEVDSLIINCLHPNKKKTLTEK